MHDGGKTSKNDNLEVYCCEKKARVCLSGEVCPWRGGCGEEGGITCERSGLSSDWMAKMDCQGYNGMGWVYCSLDGQLTLKK